MRVLFYPEIDFVIVFIFLVDFSKSLLQHDAENMPLMWTHCCRLSVDIFLILTVALSVLNVDYYVSSNRNSCGEYVGKHS